MYAVNEIFYSLQGEGFNTGTPAVFVRLSGCNLRCRFCDTDHSHGEQMSLPQIMEEVASYGAVGLVVLTGGEPALSVDDALVAGLKSLGKRVAIETNGTRPLPEGIDWVTLSPKEGFAGGDSEPCVLSECDELKVVWQGQDLAQYGRIKAKYRFLQPCYSDDAAAREANLRETVETVLRNPDWRLSLQTHRLLGIR
ncbi:MAG: radical SAM protein [Muribaculaceae bacterium]|nr:radical SAM protein [Muribaculaceae bacterium]